MRNVVAYYCSGHGYGHATRVSAFTTHLLELGDHFEVHIVSSAPAHIFSDCTKSERCHYRFAEIDPVVVQPLAYRVDRDKSVQVLERFLRQRDVKIAQELEWLRKTSVTCVLSDSAFLACAAANAASLPCALVTNFTFDSVYSYLGTLFIDDSSSSPDQHLDKPSNDLPPDVPIPESTLRPLVDQIVSDYRCADLLFRLPGAIPIPSFCSNQPIPAPNWVNLDTGRLWPEVTETLLKPVSDLALYPSVPFPSGKSKPVARQVRQAPLLVRHPTTDMDRSQILEYIGVPIPYHSHKVLIVSFGGQIIKRPTGTRTPSRTNSPNHSPPSGTPRTTITLQAPTPAHRPGHRRNASSLASLSPLTPPGGDHSRQLQAALENPHRIATPSHIYLPGAPPASNPTSPMVNAGRQNSFEPAFTSFFTPPTPATDANEVFPPAPGAFVPIVVQDKPPVYLLPTPDDSNASSPTEEEQLEELFSLLPEGWIAVVCGVAKNWGEEDLPERFFVAPRDVYMPDVTAVGDVLLGKLGYGTCAECVDSCTPFVYVPRKLFVEEHGLRMLMETAGTGVELPRERYEAGDWASTIEHAWELGRDKKIARRLLGARGDARRRRQGEDMAKEFEAWLGLWAEVV